MTDPALTVPMRERPRRLAPAVASYAPFLPAVVLLGGFFLVPLGIIVCYSFWETIDYSVVHHWTLDNYHYFFSVTAYVSTMWATLWVAALSTAVAIGLAFPFAYWLSRYVPQRLRTPLLVLVYLYFPFGALTLYSSIERFDWNQLRAAMDLGASPLQAIFRILVPQIRPGIITAIIFVFIPILGEYLTPQIVGGTGGVMIGNLIVNFFQGAQYTRGAAAALLIAGLIVVLLAVFRRSLEVEDPYGT